MGVVGLWPFLKDKGYEPVLRHQSALQNHQHSQPSLIRVGVLGAFFITVRHAYSRKHHDDAHAILEMAFTKLGPKETLVLYLDGAPALEKALTTANREEKRRTDLEVAEKNLQEFETLITANLRLRKRHFVAVTSLQVTRAQLTVLEVVSRNDYTKNVEGLGPATNYSIVKRLKSTDPIVMVNAYLADKRVVHKNTEQQTFEKSIRVFLKGEQTLVPSAITIPEQGQTYITIKAKFKELCETRVTRRLTNKSTALVNGESKSGVETKPPNAFTTIDKQNPAKAHQYRPRYSPKVRF
ncbi:hypothetical protein KVV02_000474, partial [Mortierella alpina]